MDSTDIYRGKRILIVEDDLFLGMDISESVGRKGGIVYGPVMDRESAEKIAGFGKIDAAIIDFKLGHQNSQALAEYCLENAIPCICYTGDAQSAREANMQDFVPVFEKPMKTSNLLNQLAILMSAIGN